MTFLTPFLAAALLAAPLPQDCAPLGRPEPGRVFTNADLDRIAACRALREGTPAPTSETRAEGSADEPTLKGRRTTRAPRTASPAASDIESRDALEADWRARWRSVDQKAKKLQREARELRAEAATAPRDPKKRIVGRRAPSVLIARAEALESEARELVSEFENLARRQGALPGWLRPESR